MSNNNDTRADVAEGNRLNYEDLKNGMEVWDGENVGVIEDCSDRHNILVKFQYDGAGFFCLTPNCPSEDKLYRHNEQSASKTFEGKE